MYVIVVCMCVCVCVDACWGWGGGGGGGVVEGRGNFNAMSRNIRVINTNLEVTGVDVTATEQSGLSAMFSTTSRSDNAQISSATDMQDELDSCDEFIDEFP